MTDHGPADDEIVVPLSAYEAERHQRGGSAKSKKRKAFKRTSTTEIMQTDYPEINWIIPGYLAEGFSVLAGRQKLGKTWLALDWGIAVAAGGYAMGAFDCDAGDVLYIDLENGHRRIQRRVEAIFPIEKARPDLSRLHWVTEAPGLDKGFIEAADGWRLSVPEPRLLVIDVLQRVKPAGKPGLTSYENDYAAYAELQSWATEHGIAVLGLHHTRKGGADDPLEALSGSNGLSAVADTTLVLDRDQNGMTLYVRGRDVEEKETAVRLDSGIWSILGEASDVRRSSKQDEILSALLTANAPMTPTDLVAATGMKRNNLDQILYRMAKVGEIRKAKRGQYVHPERADLIESEPL